MEGTHNNTIKDIFEIVQFIRDNAATKTDLRSEISGLRGEMRNEISSLRGELVDLREYIDKRLEDVKNEMITHVDAFVGLYQKHEAELAAVVHRQDRLEEQMKTIIQHLGLQIA